jgi:hypothetical protein
MTGREIVDSINTKGMNQYAKEALIEKIDYELKKTKRLAQDYGANLASIGFL